MKNSTLAGRIAVVAGATRGAGRGIAIELGAAGATVVVTGRSSRRAKSDYDRPETIEETADLVTEAGGQGIAVVTDHTDSSAVERLRDDIADRFGRTDILVNDIWGGEGKIDWGVPIWEQELEKGFRVLRNSTESHIITDHYLLPLLSRGGHGVLFEVSDGTLAYNLSHYRESVFYDLAKLSINRLAWGMSRELDAENCTCIGITPGWLRSEMMLEGFGVTEENWRDAAKKEPGFIHSETPRFVGRAIAALSADPDIRKYNGKSFNAYEVSQVYGFNDVDGTQPDCWTFIERSET